MKKTLFILSILVTGIFVASGQGLKALLDYSAYATPALEPYIEFVFIIGGESAVYTEGRDGLYYAEIEINVEIEEDGRIIDGIHYILTSDAYKDTLKEGKMDFADIVNYPIKNGSYVLHFSIKDLHNPSAKLQYIDLLEVHFPKDKVSISKLSLLSSISQATEDDFYVRHGLNVPPMPYSFYNKTTHSLPYISEIYNTDNIFSPGENVTIKSYIQSIDNTWLNLAEFSEIKSYPPAPIIIVVGQLDISSLPSGNYYLVMETYKNDTILLTSNSSFFQRSNPELQLDMSTYNSVVKIDNSFASKYSDLKELQEYVSYLYPIGSAIEQEFFNKRVSKMEKEDLQLYFYNFWIQRAPDNPEKAWLEYYEKVKFVNNEYGNRSMKGYKTDRGRVFLRYGPPNSIRESPYSPAMYPYEIWHYYYLEGESNVKFVFVNTDMVSKDYELYHSTLRGELKDPAWQLKLVRDRRGIGASEELKPEKFWGNDMDDNWNNP